MPSTRVDLTLNGAFETLEVDLETACVRDVADAFGCQVIRRAADGTVLGHGLSLQAMLQNERSPLELRSDSQAGPLAEYHSIACRS